MSKKKPKLQCVYVQWIDTVADPESGWKDPEACYDFFDRKDNVCEQVGFIFDETKKYLCLVSMYMPSTETPIYGMRIKIPKKWILKRKDIKL